MSEKKLSTRKYLITILTTIFSILKIAYSATTEDAIGTILPTLKTDSRYRVFNDLFKQSSKFETYSITDFRRNWGVSLTYGTNLYPSILDPKYAAGAEVNLYEEVDTELKGKNIRSSFDGDGEIKIFQNSKLILTLETATNAASFVLETLDPIMIYITKTNINDLVRNIQLIPEEIYMDSALENKTFSKNFLSFLEPFNLIRFCYWQGQQINKANYQILWNERVKDNYASQVSTNFGISLEHIIELANLLNVIPYFCIPETSDDNYVIEMAKLIRKGIPVDKKIYLEYGNAYTVMNDIPDALLSQKFSIFLENYGIEHREKIVFTLNYRVAQYFINAIGERKTKVNYDYIDCIGVDGSFADGLNIFNAYNVSDDELIKLILHKQLDYEVIINRAYRFALHIGKEFITFQGSPQLKAPRYEWRFMYDFKKNETEQNLIYKNQEIELSDDLHEFHKNSFVKEILHNWLIRLKNIGIKTIISAILVDPYTDNRDFIPLVENLSSKDSTFYQAYVAYRNNEKCAIELTAEDPNIPCDKNCVYGDCTDEKCVCYEGYEGELCDVKSQNVKSDCNDFIGVNIDGNADWSTQVHFIDLMKNSREWIYELPWGGWGSAQDLKGTVEFDEQDYPKILPPNISLVALMVRDLETHYDQGRYTVLYDGDGTLTFAMDVTNTFRSVGRIYIDVIPQTQLNNGIVVKIERSNPNDPIRNIRVIRPGFEKLYKKLIFHPMFLSQLKPFNTIRYMDFYATNSQKDQDWSNRTLEQFRTYTINGAPLETMIKLSNLSGKHMWINVPYLANDEYIKNMAELIYENLRPDLKLYVEYSNEVWGNLYPGGIHAEHQGLIMKLSNDGVQARFCYLGYITNKISQIFRSVFSASDKLEDKQRLKIVISTQSVNADTTKRILECQNSYEHVDAVAIAPYFSDELNDEYTADYVFETLMPKIFEGINKDLQSHHAIIQKYNLEFYNYESGQGFLGSTQKQTDFQISIQDDERMKAAYIEYLKLLKSNGVSLTMLFTLAGKWSKYGSWGHLRYIDVNPENSKKIKGVLDYLSTEETCKFEHADYTSCPLDDSTGLDTCSNNGVCFMNNCFCYENFSGEKCDVGKFIDYFYCGYKCTFDQGVCVLKETIGMKRFYGCNCNEGYKGHACSIPICKSECSYNGICVKPDVCECFQGRKGDSCEIDCGCDGHGVCSDTTNECICDQGFNFDKTLKKCLPVCKTTTGTTTENCQSPNDLKCINPSNPNSICSDNGICRNGKCSCFTGYIGTNCETNNTGKDSLVTDNIMPVGINVGGLSYWTTQFIFKNYFYHSSEFIPLYYPEYFNSTIQYTWNTEEDFPKLPNGYPTELKDHQIVSKLVLRDIQLKYPKELDFILLYDGEGVINIGFDAKITNRRAGRIELTAIPSTVRDNGVFVSILKTNPKNPIRNIRLVNKKDEFNYEKDLLNDSFKEFLKPFSSIRFMDLLHTNGNTIVTPEDETLPDQDTQARPNGINSDILIKIVKYSGKSPWMCIPHKANDDYVKKIATKLKERLPKHLTIYVEYSNEVWNTWFEQGKYAQEQATLLGLENHHKFYAKRSLEIFNIFKEVFGSDEQYRLKFVISTQFVSSWVTEQILSYGDIAKTAHLLAVGSYYDCGRLGSTQNSANSAIKTVEELVKICEDNLDTLDAFLQPQKLIAEQNNLVLIAYECGTSISEEQTIYDGNETPGLTEKLIAVNRHPKMKTIYSNYLNMLKEKGLISINSPSMIFSSIGLPSKYGSWGVLDYSDQVYESPSHPKFEAIKEFSNNWVSDPSGKCDEGKFIYNWKCFDKCPSNTLVETSTKSCVEVPLIDTDGSIEMPQTCDTNPCKNSGKCSISEKTVICKCPDNFLGKLCEITSEQVKQVAEKFESMFQKSVEEVKVDDIMLKNIATYTNFIKAFPQQKNKELTSQISNLIGKNKIF